MSRRQLEDAGWAAHDLERALRRRDLRRVHRGVFVTHTGPLSWLQRAWAACLVTGPSALAGTSALRAFGVRTGSSEGPVHVAVAQTRRVTAPQGIVVHRVSDLDARVSWTLSPPRERLEQALVAVASLARSEDELVALLADACQCGRTTPERLRRALAGRPRTRGRAFMEEVLTDVREGAHSPLERRYLRDVERRHALPRARRQVRVVNAAGVAYRDVEALAGLVVELDGSLGHTESADRWDDLDRDLASAADGDTTVRIGWRQVLASCRTAAIMTRLLWRLGWEGWPRACGPSCEVAVVVQARRQRRV